MLASSSKISAPLELNDATNPSLTMEMEFALFNETLEKFGVSTASASLMILVLLVDLIRIFVYPLKA